VPHDLWLESPIINPFEKKTNTLPQTDKALTFDFEYLKTQFGDAYRAIFAEIAPSFLEHAYQELQRLEHYVAESNSDKIRKTSHSMKGSASSIGLNDLANLLLQLENNASDSDAKPIVKKVRTLMDKLKPVIEHELEKQV